MLTFLKVFFRGILTTILLPFILLIWVVYAVFCIFAFIVMFFRSIIDFFLGKTFSADLPEDLEAKRMLLERQKADQESKMMIKEMYDNMVSQPKIITPENANNAYQQSSPYPQPQQPTQSSNANQGFYNKENR